MKMLESDQVTFPSFAPSLSDSPKPENSLIVHDHHSNHNYSSNNSHYDVNGHNQNQISQNQRHKNIPNSNPHLISVQISDSLAESTKNYQNASYSNKYDTVDIYQSPMQNLQQINQKTVIKQKEQKDTFGVRIYCRLRPQVKTSYEYKYDTQMIDDGENCYTFDHIFGKFTSQEYLYNKIINRHIEDFMKGRNSTIFAYGQTGSGKTHTMFGDLKDPMQFGIIPRTLEQIFWRSNSSESPQYEQSTISCSMLEIYNQKMMDLFSFPQQTGQNSANELKLKEVNENIMIDGLIEVEVENKEEVLDLIRLGHRNRKVATTYNNDASSRSHTVLFVYRTFEYQGEEYKCKMCFIDLAGSQKVRKSGVKGQTLQEAKKINLSLSCLGNVVHALTSNSEHIPYRNSKLTRILKDSLSGETNTSIITTCSTDKMDYNQTISTIKFAVRAKKIKNKKKLDNVDLPIGQVLKKLKKELIETKKELDWYKMKDELEKCNVVDIPEEDTCLMPLKMMMTGGVSTASRVTRQRSQTQTFSNSQCSLLSPNFSETSSICSESSSKRIMH